jgi:hypothetical protein
MSFKTAAATVGNGLLDGLCAIADAQTRNRIAEIDSELEVLRKQMIPLQEERDQLEQQLSR